ncbi:MAG: hypothetical protein LBE59_11580 [Nevskiaceae bacterium]|jgi:hypothetical protein|nr:hypothetical protein [Nevskiaceae bacterium]
MRSNMPAAALAASLGVAAMALPHAAHAQSTADIAELRAQIAALETRLNQLQAQAERQSGNNATQAQARATPDAKKTDSDVDALTKLVNNTQISNRMYSDITNVDKKVGNTKIDPTGVSFDIKRFYVGIDHKFNDMWAMNFTTDFLYNSTSGASQLYIKKAYIEAKVSPLLKVRFGADDLPWILYSEGIYNYRWVEKTLSNNLGQEIGADWGIHASGAVPSGVFSYSASVINGSGYKSAPDNGTNNRSKGMDFEGRIGFQAFSHLNIGVGGYVGKRGKDTYANGASTTNEVNTASRVNALIAYTEDKFRVGVEWFEAKDYANPFMSIGATSVKQGGYSAFGNVALTQTNINLFARYDRANLNKDAALNPSYTYYNVGVEFPITKGVKIAPVYKHTEQDGATAGTDKTRINEFGVFGEFRF